MTIFWDMESLFLVYFTPKGQSVNSDNYCELLRLLEQKIKSKRRAKLSKGVILLQDNARPYTAKKTVLCLKDLGFELLNQPPYSPDLVPNDFHLFGPLKEELRGNHYLPDEEIIEAVKSTPDRKLSSRKGFTSSLKDGQSA
ncbi:histone-lysine N-methyltransferase SETMAR-like [Lycorma delicatula]|uniref:histone-lysine N-methyltransferase SETMAR-like n=1 Tax=Lycorma delicatula TaxID=130591 RepID=UPI003F5154A3